MPLFVQPIQKWILYQFWNILGWKPYLCKKCHKAFSHNAYLKELLRIRSQEKWFSCNQCSKAFSRNAHLKDHLRIHSNEKLYTCYQCPKSFSILLILRSIWEYIIEKLFPCHQFCMEFSQNNHLKKPMPSLKALVWRNIREYIHVTNNNLKDCVVFFHLSIFLGVYSNCQVLWILLNIDCQEMNFHLNVFSSVSSIIS